MTQQLSGMPMSSAETVRPAVARLEWLESLV